jgi:chemotaxis protein MotB
MFTLVRRGRNAVNVWPAFVDALASVLLVLIFTMLVFVLGQFVLSSTLAGRERAIDDLTRQIAALSETLALERTRALELLTQLEATLADRDTARERAQLAEALALERGAEIDQQRAALAARGDELARLNQQVAALREQLARLSAALAASEAKASAQQIEIARLGERLNLALARQVEELQRYRSEFFGRLRKVLGNHPSVRIVGDRFVFQSELLFPSGEAALTPEGERHLAQLAETLIAVTRDLPRDIPWILRIDGHTDRRPIRTAEFPSNWELSTARALSVVRFLITRGIPPQRLAAGGFGEYYPLDPAETPAAYARNRRIEIKLTPP